MAVLTRARGLGYLGPGPVEPHVVHAEAFGLAVEQVLDRVPRSFVDLGTGGGVPGLVLARRWPDAIAVLVESNGRRAASLRDALVQLGFGARVDVAEGRAEVAAHDPRYRERFDVVTARGLAEPAATAEIATGFVVVGGAIVVSEPPSPRTERWPPDPLRDLGLAPATLVEAGNAHFAVLRKAFPAPQRYPRPVGRPSKRPLW